jgi:hypothetical protein
MGRYTIKSSVALNLFLVYCGDLFSHLLFARPSTTRAGIHYLRPWPLYSFLRLRLLGLLECRPGLFLLVRLMKVPEPD